MRTGWSLAAMLLIGPCITVSVQRNYNVYQMGTDGPNEVQVTVEKEENIDGKIEGSVTGIEASANATASSVINTTVSPTVNTTIDPEEKAE